MYTSIWVDIVYYYLVVIVDTCPPGSHRAARTVLFIAKWGDENDRLSIRIASDEVICLPWAECTCIDLHRPSRADWGGKMLCSSIGRYFGVSCCDYQSVVACGNFISEVLPWYPNAPFDLSTSLEWSSVAALPLLHLSLRSDARSKDFSEVFSRGS